MNVLAWRHHFPIISLWEIFRRSMAPNSEGSVSRFIKHLSGLQSKQHEVQLLQQLLHTCINKTKKQNEWEHTILPFRSISQTPNSRCPFSHADTCIRQTWTPTYTCTIALQHIWIIKIKIQANTIIFYVGENIIIYTIIHMLLVFRSVRNSNSSKILCLSCYLQAWRRSD